MSPWLLSIFIGDVVKVVVEEVINALLTGDKFCREIAKSFNLSDLTLFREVVC